MVTSGHVLLGDVENGLSCNEVSYTSFLKQSTSGPIRRKFDEVIFKEDEAWERS
jgi:hypothetical protein